jgi:hypothetical protein
MRLTRTGFIYLNLVLALALLVGALSVAAAQDNNQPAPLFTPTPTVIPRPRPANTLNQEKTTLDIFFDKLPQGQAGLLHISGAGLAGARARFLDKLIDFFPAQGDGFYGLIAARMEQPPRKYDLDIFTWFGDNSRQTINTSIEVVQGNFIGQQVDIPPDKAYLVDPEIERNELARMESIFSTVTTEHLWGDKGFALPIPSGTLISPFGAFRTFNGSIQTRHTGWDIKAAQGQPLMASAAGRVAYAGRLEIRGSIVVVDHGYGVFTSYSHLSETHVTRGQTLSAGQIVGTVGNTGRTSGAHFHWEVAVNDIYVDAAQFIQLWLPGK